MARTKKSEREKLSSKVSFRLPEEVNRAWREAAAAAGMSLADWLRSQIKVDGVEPVVTNKPTPKRGAPRKRPYVPADPALIREVARIGNNLNQVARHINRHGAAGHELKILEQLINIERELAHLLNSYAKKGGGDAH